MDMRKLRNMPNSPLELSYENVKSANSYAFTLAKIQKALWVV